MFKYYKGLGVALKLIHVIQFLKSSIGKSILNHWNNYLIAFRIFEYTIIFNDISKNLRLIEL